MLNPNLTKDDLNKINIYHCFLINKEINLPNNLNILGNLDLFNNEIESLPEKFGNYLKF
jgi:hypothetical protein